MKLMCSQPFEVKIESFVVGNLIFLASQSLYKCTSVLMLVMKYCWKAGLQRCTVFIRRMLYCSWLSARISHLQQFK